jgi:hypothetical protein
MSNYFPNARPNENITTTLRAVNDDPIVVLLVATTPASPTNLREHILSDYLSNPFDYPAYETSKDLVTVLNKVNVVQVLSGLVEFPDLSSAAITVPASGLTFYGNSNFNTLSVNTSRVILYIK